MPRPFNKTLDLKLIQMVKENPMIYNVRHPKYMDFDAREVFWHKIGDELGRPACEFAALQLQIQLGDYQEERHKNGYLEHYKELLPSNISNKSGLDKRILKEYSSHQGMSELDAKHLYTKTARDLPTYGVTFFVVKEKQQKGKKKLVPRLLGINANAILRLDEESKEILQAWPLTQVMSYQVGKSHTFTLNFGDYSDKEYSVKTNDAVRIRDILQGYIDIIAKRLAGKHSSCGNDGHAVMEDVVQVSRGNTIQLVQNNPSKLMQESFVGPTKILSYEPGQSVSQGTQLVTVQQVIISNKAANQQYTLTGGVPRRQGMSMEFVKKLNKINSNSVKVVNLITSGDGPHNAELKTIVGSMENDMPQIASGVNEAVKDMDAASRKVLLDELAELEDFMKTLSRHVYGVDPEGDATLEAASKLADLSTQMYLGLDPLTKRRSNLIRLSRQSFIEDEKVDANLRKALFLTAAGNACAAVENAGSSVNQKYDGPALSISEVETIEQGARDKMRKLNGAVALFLTAHADPKNVDYSAAVTSMNAIKDLIQELANDARALASTKDGESRQELIDDVSKLCDVTKLVCSVPEGVDREKLQDVTSMYGPVADKLMFTFGRGRRDDKDNKIIELSKDVGEKTSLLLMKANELTGLVPSTLAAEQLDDAGVRCAGAASDLLACAMLTSPCIHELHCQSALTASAEALSSAAQHLLVVAKPMVDQPSMRDHGEQLKERSLDLAKALDNLKNAYGNEESCSGMEASTPAERQRLKFIMRLADANKELEEAEQELDKPSAASKQNHSPVVVAMLEKNLAQRMAEYNAAVAALLMATSDADNPDYEAAASAITTINELVPGIVKDTKAFSASKDEATRQAMLDDVRQLCAATRGICAHAGEGNNAELNKCAANLANRSNKLYFTFKPSAPTAKEQEILELATQACTQASGLCARASQLSAQSPAPLHAPLHAHTNDVANKAKALLTCAQTVGSNVDYVIDLDNPDYDAANGAVATINEMMPLVVKETKAMSSTKSEDERKAMLDELRKLCEATSGVCDTAHQQPDKQRVFAAQCGAASGRLVYVLNPQHRPARANQVMQQAHSACATAQKLANNSNKLASQAPCDVTDRMLHAGDKTRSAADTLVTSAQLTASSIDNPHCKAALLSSVDALSSSAQQLTHQWAPLRGGVDDGLLRQLENENQELQRQLEMMRGECNTEVGLGGRSVEEERQRLQFVKSAAAAKKGLDHIEKEFSKPFNGDQPTGKLVMARRQQLSDAMARLSSAIAALTAASADPDHPDYLVADEAMATITELMPLVIMDTKAMAATKDDKTRDAMLAELRALYDSTRDICDTKQEPAKLRESARKFGVASSKLVFVLNPTRKPAAANQVIKQANLVSATANQLVKDSYKLADKLYATDLAADRLRQAGTKTVGSIDALLTATQLTAPSLGDQHCQSVLQSSIDALSLSAHFLAQQWAPIQALDKQELVKKLDKQHAELQLQLDDMRNKCQIDEIAVCTKPDADSTKPDADRSKGKEGKRVRFADSVATTRSNLEGVAEDLTKPYTGTLPKGQALSFRQLQLSNSLARLNAALAALAVATADLDDPDYSVAYEAMNTIRETLPQVVKDTKAMAAVQDDIRSEAMLGNARALCAATSDICDASERDPVALRNAAKKFATASGKLIYVVNARAKPNTAKQVMESTQAAYNTAGRLVKHSSRLTDQLAPSDVTSYRIKESGGKTADAADALMTAAQLTAPCISDPSCKASLSSSIDSLSTSAQVLSRHWSPLLHEPLLTSVIRELEKESRQLNAELGDLKTLCQDSKGKDSTDKTTQEQKMKEDQKSQYIAKAVAAKEAMLAAEKELDKPVLGAPAHGEAARAQQLQLAPRAAQLHAAMMALYVATSDNNNPDYVTAEKSIDNIKELVPHVVKSTNALLASKDSASREANVVELRALCRDLAEVCDSVEKQDSAKTNELLTKKAIPKLGKLYYVVHPKVGMVKMGKVESYAKSSGCKASQLLTSVFQLAEAAGDDAGRLLDQRGSVTADAAKALLTAVQLTGPYIHEPEAQSTLISVADALSSSAHDLAAAWSPIIQLPDHKTLGVTLETDLRDLDAELEKFKKACTEAEPENIVHQTKSKPKPPPRKVNDEEVKQKLFTAALEKVTGGLLAAEEDIKRVYTAKLDTPKMHKDQVKGVQKALENKIALTNVATSALLVCNASDPMDYTAATKSTSDLASLVPKIAQDAKVLSNTMSEKEKKAFLDDILAMFDATKKVIDTAQNNRKNLNGVAVEYGNKSGALLYSVCTEFDPSHEKEVISRAKDIGESVAAISTCSARLLTDAGGAGGGGLCAAGGACVTAAGNLVYTAKLVAPSIQVPECQEILQETSQTLSSKIKTFATAWQPLADDPQHKACVEELNVKAAKAEGLLVDLRKDLEAGRLVKLRPLELLEVEHTPLRTLTAALIDNAMKKSSSPSLPAERKRAYVEYARSLTAACDLVDRANALCKKHPHDVAARGELEDAVQSLLVLALQQRPAAGQAGQYIVDLTEYVKELSKEADGMVSAAASCSTKHKDIAASCQHITAGAELILHPANLHNRGDGTTVDDIYEVDRFGRATNDQVKKITSTIEVLPENKDKTVLSSQAVNLEDSCNILRFATNSAIATTQSASLDETLHDLTDLETRIDQMLADGDKNSRRVDEPIPWPVRSSLLQAARSVSSQPQLAAVLTRYIHEQRARIDCSDAEGSKRLKEHLRKLTYLLRVLVVDSCRRTATWQPLHAPEAAALLQQVIREIDVGCSFNRPTTQGGSVLQNIDLDRLLLSTDVINMEGDRKHIEDKLQQTSTKLSSTLSTVVASCSRPGSMTRSLAVTADTAGELAALARAMKRPDDPVYNAKIEEAVKEATFQTYNVMKASELVSQEPNNPAYRRGLLDACRLLNDALNNLGRAASPSNKMQRECGESSRALLLQQTLLHAPQPTCALPYADCLHALHTQNDIIQKLNNDQPMSKEEFSRTLGYISSAVCNSSELAAQCGYLMSLPEREQAAATTGLVDVQLLTKVTDVAQDTCYRILQLEPDQAKEEAVNLMNQTRDICQALNDAEKKSLHLKEELGSAAKALEQCAQEFNTVVSGTDDKAKISSATCLVLQHVQSVTALTEHPALLPAAAPAQDQRERCEHVLSAARDLTNKTVSLVRDVKSRAGDDDDEPMTWVTFNHKRKDVLKAFEALLASVRENGQRAGILEVEKEVTEEEAPKSYIETQVELANKWLKRPNCKPEVKASGEDAVRKVINIAEKMSADMKDSEKEDMCVLISETKDLLAECSTKYNKDQASLLVERVKALKKAIERGVITMVVEELMVGEEPLQDLDVLLDATPDESKRKFLLERKIAELLAQLARATRAARAVVGTAAPAQHARVELTQCSEQANLLAPLLVKAAQDRVNTPDNKDAIENYKALLAQYAESLSKVRELCDQSVDPMEFVQTASETMQRLREDSTHDNDPHKCAYTSYAISKLANRVIDVSMSSRNAKQDPELLKALSEAQKRLQATSPGPHVRRSRIPDWKDTTAEILRTTGEVEACMGGEMIFKNQQQSDQPIFAAARDLHTAVREWSARDNEIVAVAKRMAVLMAKLSAYMNTNKKHELIVTSKDIVSNSHEVAELARKLAGECTDIRIKTNLLQVCDRIPTISGQLKMLTTVKGSTLNRPGNKEDQDSLTMLVDNAQNLMLSIQEVVKVAAGASVKIASQRGGVRVRWVRRQYYY